MSLYPLNIKIENKKCVVIGAGKVGFRKIKALAEAGANVKVISSECRVQSLEKVQGLEPKNIELIERSYQKGDLKGAYLVIAATDNKELNKEIASEARREKALVNVVDDKDLSDFFAPSFIKRGELIISISTSGKYPYLSRKIREELELIFGDEYEDYIELLSKIRNKVNAKYDDEDKRREVLRQIADLFTIKKLSENANEQVKEKIEHMLTEEDSLSSVG